jgi:glycosyltransferase involved in cell wall biosynthesis
MSERRRVLVSSRLFLPEAGAAAYRLGALASALASRAVDVDVLTTTPPRGSLAPADPPGVHVSRWPVLRDKGGNVRGYLQFASFDGPLVARLLSVRTPDVIVTEPPPTTGTVVRVASALRRVPYVYYAGDVSSTAAQGIGVASPVVALLRRVEAWAMSGAAAVLAVSDGVAEEVRRLTRDRVPVVVVGTGVDTDVFAPPPAAARDPQAGPTFVYAGTMSEIHGAGVFVEAFAKVAQAHPDARLVMCGQGTEEPALRRRAAALVGDRVEFRGMLSGGDVATLFAGARAGLASLHPDMGYDYAFPTKMFASTACGTPVVYAGPGPGRALVLEHDLGWTCDWDVGQVAAALGEALATEPDPATRARLRAWTVQNASQAAVARRAADTVLEVSDSCARGGRARPGRPARAEPPPRTA